VKGAGRKTIGKPSDGAGNQGFQVMGREIKGSKWLYQLIDVLERGTEKEKGKRSAQKKQ